MKKRPLGPLLILGMLLFTSPAMAGQPGSRAADDSARTPGEGVAGRPELTPEQRETAARIFDMHGERLRRLREGVCAVTTELAAARGADKDDLEERIARLDELREQLLQERLAVRAELAADGISDFPSHSRGPYPATCVP